MTTYSIRIYNRSGVDKSYSAFMASPQVASEGGVMPVYANVWAAFPDVTDGSWDTVEYTENFYAFWGRLDKELSAASVIDSGGAKAVNTATRDTVTFANSGATGFTQVSSPGSAQDGSFSIVCSTDFTPLNFFVFGLALDDGSPIPAPVATFNALPNETYNITPVVKFYITDARFQTGQVIDLTTLSATVADIDFTGRPQTTATVTQDDYGAFSVSYD